MSQHEIAKINKIFYIDSSNAKMCSWAISYLAKRYSVPSSSETNSITCYQAVIRTLVSIKNEDEQELALKKMKAAWNQKVRRERTDRKACLYSLTPEAQGQLALLAKSKGQPIYRTLEMIIDKAYRGMKSKKTPLESPKTPLGPPTLEDISKELLKSSYRDSPPGPGIKIL